MKIDRATLADAPMMERLWRDVFEDDAQDIRAFLQQLLASDTAWIVRADDAVVSMLFVIDAQLVTDAGAYPVGYIYAGATHPRYRSQGCYRALLSAAEDDAVHRGLAALFLQPADADLTQTYERQGFTVPLYAHATKGLSAQRMGEYLSAEQYEMRRATLLQAQHVPFIRWPMSVYRLCQAWGASFLGCDGRVMAVSSDDEATVWEQTDMSADLCVQSVGRLKPLAGDRCRCDTRIYMGYGMD